MAEHDLRSEPCEVVITGLGATTPLGGNVADTWAGLLAGRSGVKVLDQPWAKDFPARIVASLAVEPTETLTRVEARRLDRCQQVAVVAAREAWAHAELAGGDGVDPDRLAVCMGTGIGGALTLLGQDDVLEERGPGRVSPLSVPMLMPNGPAAAVSIDLGARAGAHTAVSACATGAEALAWAVDIIHANRADAVIAGGADACIHPLPMAGFSQARTLSTRNDDPEGASRPFDKGRDGFVLGEGAGALILERGDHARARGATIYGIVAGAGITSDAYHITSPDPTGRGQKRAIQFAMERGGLSASDIGHVNAHATSTPVGDMMEIKAIRDVIGSHAILTAPKSMLGHLLGAAGAVESIATVLSIRDGVIPVTRNLEDPDDELDLDVVRIQPRKVQVQAAINDSFGFGGHNVAVAFRRV
jgi:3-oxoacyl-[acyl-carrier-protein] synthase II